MPTDQSRRTRKNPKLALRSLALVCVVAFGIAAPLANAQSKQPEETKPDSNTPVKGQLQPVDPASDAKLRFPEKLDEPEFEEASERIQKEGITDREEIRRILEDARIKVEARKRRELVEAQARARKAQQDLARQGQADVQASREAGEMGNAQALTAGGIEGEKLTFSAFSEPVDLVTLIEFVREELDLSLMLTDPGIIGEKVVISSPITIPVDQVLPFLRLLLEQKNYTLTLDDKTGIYLIVPTSGLPAQMGQSDLATVRVIPVKGIRPSSLEQPIRAVTQATGGANARNIGIQFLDELGLIMLIGTPTTIDTSLQIIERVIEETTQFSLRRYPVNHIAASVCLDRILALVGQPSATATASRRPANPAAAGGDNNQRTAIASGALSNLPDRLAIDPQDNALLFRGRIDEGEQLEQLLAIVDVPNRLGTRWYPVGTSAASAVTEQAGRLGLGNTQTVDLSSQSSRVQRNQPQVPSSNIDGAGPAFVIYPEAGGFMYRGTESQHAIVQHLVEELSDLIDTEIIVYEFFKLKYADAEETASLIQSLITAQVQSANSSGSLLGNDLSRRGNQNNLPGQSVEPEAEANALAAGESVAITASDEVFVTADIPNNQIIVRAPRRQQPQFKRLIERIDVRRPQVYIDVQIVTMTATDDFRLAFETQIINANGSGGAFRTNFGLSTPGATLTDPVVPATNLLAGTAALIFSDQVPVIINALQQTADGRVVSRPQLLVDDNEEASIVSLDQQPTTTVSQGDTTSVTSFGGFQDAGTQLTVTPHISEGGFLTLEYEIQQSAFTSQPLAAGIPGSRREDTIQSSVTVKSDMTIVVGGLVFNQTTDDIIKVPLLGDLPIVGALFRDSQTSETATTLYVFITPRILNDPDFIDSELLTRGALEDVHLPTEDVPLPNPIRMEILTRPDDVIAPDIR